MPKECFGLLNEAFDSAPQRGETVPAGGVQGQHGVVMDARFLGVRELRDEQTEVHGDGSEYLALRIHEKASRTEFGARDAHGEKGLLALPRQG